MSRAIHLLCAHAGLAFCGLLRLGIFAVAG